MYNIHLSVAFKTKVLDFTASGGFSDSDTENKLKNLYTSCKSIKFSSL